MSRAFAILLTLWALPCSSFGQTLFSNRNAHWAASRNLITFDGTSALPSVDTLPATGHACISDTAGHLLGYLARDLSNQWWGVFDSAGSVVPGFPADLTLASAGYRPATFIPKPGYSDSTHLIFIGRPTGTSVNNAGMLTMRIYGAGAQPPGTAPGINWFNLNVGGCLTAVPTVDDEGYWVVVQPVGTSAFHSHRLDGNGISPSPVISAAGPVRAQAYRNGHLVASRAGDRFVASYRNASYAADTMRIEVFGFDAATGNVSHTATLQSRRPEGIEFSPSGRFLYVLEHHLYIPLSGVRLELVQYDLEAGDISSSRTMVHMYEEPGPGYIGVRNQLLLGIDGRIYRCHERNTDTLGVIMQPDLPGEACSYDHQGFVCLSVANSLPMPLKRYIDAPGIATRSADTDENLLAVCWPQPLTDHGTLSHPNLGGWVILEWRDAAGRLVRSRAVIAADGRARLDATGLPAGTYLLRAHPKDAPAPVVARVQVSP